MRRWHTEEQHMFRQWKLEMGKHGYDWRNPPIDGSACHCARGIGVLRKRRAGDCGRPRCGVCHWGKWHPKGRFNAKRAAILFELKSEA